MPTTASQRATEAQTDFIFKLLNQRVLPEGLSGSPLAEALLSKVTASQFIDLLKSLPFARTIGSASTSGSFVPADVVNEVPAGTYTVVMGSDDYVTLRLAREAWCGGKMVASYLYGSDNEFSYKAFAFVTPSGIRPFQSFRSNTRLVKAAQTLMTTPLADAREAFLNQAEAYALRSGKCLNCLHTLTVPASLLRGLGPVCAANLGVV
jgi:Family of unknown function (DUF6011)